MNDNITRPLSYVDLDQVARIHIQAFPESTLSRFGKTLVKQYYAINMAEPNECYAIGVFSDDQMTGFCFAGVFRDVKSTFLRKNGFLLLTKGITRPWLIFNKKIRLRSKSILTYVRKERKAIVKNKASVSKKRRRFGILSIAVDPMFRSKGLGKLLMLQCERHAISNNFDMMDLTVDVNNSSTIHFYQGLGWTKVLSEGESWSGRMEKRLVSE